MLTDIRMVIDSCMHSGLITFPVVIISGLCEQMHDWRFPDVCCVFVLTF